MKLAFRWLYQKKKKEKKLKAEWGSGSTKWVISTGGWRSHRSFIMRRRVYDVGVHRLKPWMTAASGGSCGKGKRARRRTHFFQHSRNQQVPPFRRRWRLRRGIRANTQVKADKYNRKAGRQADRAYSLLGIPLIDQWAQGVLRFARTLLSLYLHTSHLRPTCTQTIDMLTCTGKLPPVTTFPPRESSVTRWMCFSKSKSVTSLEFFTIDPEMWTTTFFRWE